VSLTDKVIKNTLYNFLSQFAAFIAPLLLTPFIIGKIGQENFGIYAIILGFTGTFGLLDFSLSTSFVKFISEYYNKKKFPELNSVLNTGILFYLSFSFLVIIAGYFFSKPLLRIINIPDSLFDSGVLAFRISLLSFFISNTCLIFTSVLISIQRMYIVSIAAFIATVFNIVFTIVFILSGFGLIGLMWSQLITVCIISFIPVFYSFKHIPELRIGFGYPGKHALKDMGKFGIQMQLSKLATFASEKYDEILLGIYTSLSNVTYFNLAVKLGRFGRFIPMQVVNQVAPVAAEFKAKEENEKLIRLFSDITKYLTLISISIIAYIFTFANLLLFTWMGVEYPLSVHITKILMVGQAVNLIFSAPGNSITPNIGIPKFQMFEGLIQLVINLIVSIILIINFGVLGAAYGNTIAVIISSFYVFIVSSGFFKTGKLSLLYSVYLKPFIACLIAAVGSYLLFIFIFTKFITAVNRSSGLILIFLTGTVFLLIYFILILVLKYLNKNDKTLIFNTLSKFIPPKIIGRYKTVSTYEYKGELISFFIVTHNRSKMLRQCAESLLNTIKNLNYELIIWDNNSIDETKSYLSELSKSDERIKVVLHHKNAGTNAKGLAADMCRGDYIFGIDDDVLEYPDDWVLDMLSAYNCIPFMGYLATDVHQNEFTNGAKFGSDKYINESYFGGKYNLLVGPTGGWCFLISRRVYNEVGKFLILSDRIFFAEDGDYGYRVIGKGLKTGILEGVKVFHATGDYYNKEYGDVLASKYKSFNLPLPLKYKIERKLKILFSLKKFYRKIIDSSLSSKS
jgi:O-antigen/teichoic acid export membrane protein